MALKKPQVIYLGALPIRQGMYRATLFMMAALALSLFIMNKAGSPATEKLRASINDTITPVLSVVARPFDAVSDFGAWLANMALLHSENIALKNQNVQLMKWQAMAKDMEAENRSLKALLKVVPARGHAYVTARIVSDLGGPFMHSALINGGSESGISKDQAVINEHGLVGRVVEVGKTSGRVLLLADINSRVPVMSEQSREKSILVGNNNDLPTLSYVAAGNNITVGERVVTSGDGGIFPAGLPVGVVSSVDKGVIRVQPFVDVSKAEYVSTVDYSF